MTVERVVGVWRGVALLALAGMVLVGCGGASSPADGGEDAGGEEQVSGDDDQTDGGGDEAAGGGDEAAGGGDEAAGGGDEAAGGGTALAGTMSGFITHAGETTITFDEIEVLSGQEAAAARSQDGEPPVEEGLDIPYLRNPTEEAYEIQVAEDVRVQVFDCSAECQLVDWAYDDLVNGTPLPYGSPETPFTVTVHDGEVVEITEIYLP